MKAALFGILAAAAVSVANAGDYLTNFEEGKKKAASEKKSLLVKFTGSDWCPPCKKLHGEVFSKSKFQKGVAKDFVVVVLDFPRQKELPKKEAEANRKVAKEYKIRSYPTVLLMDAKGEVFKSMAGYRGENATDYLKNLKTSLKASKFK